MSYVKDEIRRILCEADYMGLIGSGAPLDEYENEVNSIFQRFGALQDEFEQEDFSLLISHGVVNRIVAHVFCEWFETGKPDYEGVKKISAQIAELYECKAADSKDLRFSQRIKK